MERPFIGRTAVGIGLGVAAVALVALFVQGTEVFLLAFAALLFAIFLRTPAEWVAQRTPLSSAPAVGVVVLFLFLMLVGTGLLLGSGVAKQFQQLHQQLPDSSQAARQWLNEKTGGNADAYLQKAKQGAGQLLKKTAGAVSATFGLVANLILILFVGLFFALSPRTYREGLVHLVPRDKRERAREVLGATWLGLQHWLFGKLVTMSVVAAVTTVGLLFLDIPMALALGLLAGMLDFVPNIGPIISSVPALLLASSQGGGKVLAVAGLFLGVQTLSSYVLEPLVQKRTVELPPALLLLSQVLITFLFGIFGLLLATPLTAAALVLVRMLYVEDVLGDRTFAQSKRSGAP